MDFLPSARSKTTHTVFIRFPDHEMEQNFYERIFKSRTELRKSEMKGGQTFSARSGKLAGLTTPIFVHKLDSLLRVLVEFFVIFL